MCPPTPPTSGRRPYVYPAPAQRTKFENAYQVLEGQISGSGFRLAVAVKASVRSDRLYQPLFEANVLKYLVWEVLRGAAFKFHVHVMDTEGAAVAEAYKAASLFSLLRGGQPEKAVDRLLHLTTPRALAEAVIGELPLFPV